MISIPYKSNFHTNYLTYFCQTQGSCNDIASLAVDISVIRGHIIFFFPARFAFPLWHSPTLFFHPRMRVEAAVEGCDFILSALCSYLYTSECIHLFTVRANPSKVGKLKNAHTSFDEITCGSLVFPHTNCVSLPIFF